MISHRPTRPLKFQATCIALAALMAAPLAVHAANDNAGSRQATTPMATPTATPMATTSDRSNMPAWNDQKAQLLQALPKGHDKAFYTKALADNGYRITSINKDKVDGVEYEVVKATQTYEVQIDFDKAGGMASKIDVDSNLWRADSTKAALAGKDVPAATQYTQGNERYSDGMLRQGHAAEKTKLEKALSTGHDKAYYPAALKKMGYQVTAVNDNDKDYLELEVVKGNNSYEVQVDFDGARANKVDVANNMWHADGTDKALSMSGAKR